MYFKGHLIHAFPIPWVLNHHSVILYKRYLRPQEALGRSLKPKNILFQDQTFHFFMDKKVEEDQDLSLLNSPKVWISGGLELGKMCFPTHSSSFCIPSQPRRRHMERIPSLWSCSVTSACGGSVQAFGNTVLSPREREGSKPQIRTIIYYRFQVTINYRKG